MPYRTKRTICDACLQAVGHFNPPVGTDAPTYAVLDASDGSTSMYERITGKCDWCEERMVVPAARRDVSGDLSMSHGVKANVTTRRVPILASSEGARPSL